MVKITEELIRKKSEHNECIIGSLEELSLHQEDVEKIEYIHNWCKELQILYLQSNLISKIENLHKLKKLQYLNLAINNIEIIENLERCESLEKLDLTLNFIGNLESVCTLKNNIHLKDLHLTGNPCSDYKEYRNYVISQLPQLQLLDNVEITRSERIKALQVASDIKSTIKRAQEEYSLFRTEQKERLLQNKNILDDDLFWKSKSEHAPETRIEISRRSRAARNKDIIKKQKDEKIVSVFNKDGRLLNINQAKVNFKFDDSDPKYLILDIAIYKHLDSSYLDVDLHPIYARILIKEKVFQFVFPEEIFTDKSKAERSQTTGHLVLKMPRANFQPTKCIVKNDFTKEEKPKSIFLEIQEPIDFSKIVKNNNLCIDNNDVPPLELV